MSYEPLDKSLKAIRLLHLHPAPALASASSYKAGEDNDGNGMSTSPIKCHFTVSSLSTNPPPYYEAISYVWGSALSSQPVQVVSSVDNHSYPSSLTVTTNLYTLLQHLRLESRERVLWVDALCIEQSNLEERKHQVSLMRHIYGNAAEVIVWLGVAFPGSDLAMAFLQQLGDDTTSKLHLDPQLSPHISLDAEAIKINGERVNLDLDLDSQDLCGFIIRLFSLPWWTRTWTVPEFVLAKKLTFRCGQNALVTQEQMYTARENFWNHKDQCFQRNELNYAHPERSVSMTSSFEVPTPLDFVTKSRRQAYSVLTAIASFSERAVTDPRDRVYGMLGLGTGPYADIVEPDYKLTPEQVSLAVFLKSIEQTGTLECFSHLFEHENHQLPSFVPNWTGKFEYNGVQGLWLGYLQFFSAALNFAAQVQLLENDKLAVAGVFIDKIKHISQQSLLHSLISSGGWTNLLELAGIKSEDDVTSELLTESHLLQLWQTLNVGMEMWFKDNNRFSRRLKGSTDLSKYHKCKVLCDASPAEKGQLWNNEMSHIFLDLETGCHGRRFAVTEKGYFAMIPQKCEPDDVIVALLGGSVPYVLRSVDVPDSSRKYHKILGDAYVHGLMDGEALQPLDEIEQALEETFLI